MRGARTLLLLVTAGTVSPQLAEAAPRDAHLVSYGGYGTTTEVVVRGRVARGRPLADKPHRGTARKVLATARTFFERDVERARLVIRDLDGTSTSEVRADGDGFWVARLPGPFPVGPRRVEIALAERRWTAPALTMVVNVVDGAVGYVAVTDIDDTIIQTGVTGRRRDLLAKIAASDARDIVAYEGAAEALRAFAEGGVPVVYVSASPIELAPRLMQFLELRGFPPGALFLRHYEDDGIGDPTRYKRKRIDALLADFPGRQLLLFGDNGEQDRDIFAGLAKETGRVAWSYIRRTLPDERVLDKQLVFGDWAEVVTHAHGAGLLAAGGTP